eukprot:snap_masked-scaffold_30-processed-gene-2.19-mRNA-1 protein AED:1.00 eAED:1.00 QI:0/0/0/0/1/1/2/0/169
MVANMIRLNKITVPTPLNLPNLEIQFLSITNSSFYLTLDILSEYGFLPVAEMDRVIFALVTRRSAWRMKGAPMGWFNTPVLFFERVITEIIHADGEQDLFNVPTNGVIAWLDDHLSCWLFSRGYLSKLREKKFVSTFANTIFVPLQQSGVAGRSTRADRTSTQLFMKRA